MSRSTESSVFSLKVTVPLYPIWWGEYPGQQGWNATLLVLLATSWIKCLAPRVSIPNGRWGPCCSIDPTPMITTGSGSFSIQSSKAGRVSSYSQNLFSFPFSDNNLTKGIWINIDITDFLKLKMCMRLFDSLSRTIFSLYHFRILYNYFLDPNIRILVR